MEPSSESLAAQAVGGDKAALEALCRRLQGPLYRLALRMLGDPTDAEDCTQEVLVLIVTHLAQYEGRSRLATWAHTIAARYLLRYRVSRAETRPHSVPDLAAAIAQGLASTEPSSLPDGDARLLARDVARTCTQAMLLCLSREERLALLLTEVLGAPLAVGAEICQVRPDAFRQRLSRAREKLRPLLESTCGLAKEANPCRCVRQAAAKQQRGMKLPLLRDGTDTDELLLRAERSIAQLWGLGRVFAVDPPPAPRRQLWLDLQHRFPDLLN